MANPPLFNTPLWFINHITPHFEFYNINAEGNATTFRVWLNNKMHNLRLGLGHTTSPASFLVMGMHENPTEESILQHNRYLPLRNIRSLPITLVIPRLYDFKQSLSQEEAERLLTYLTAPYLAIPLILQVKL